DEQDLGLEVRGDGEGQAQIHAARVALDRRVDEAVHLGEGDDLVEAPDDLGPAHAENGPAQIDVLAAGELTVEAGADLDDRAQPPAQPRLADARLGDARQDLQQGALAGAVAADDPHHLAAPHVERDVAQRPDRLVRIALAGPATEPSGEGAG